MVQQNNNNNNNNKKQRKRKKQFQPDRQNEGRAVDNNNYDRGNKPKKNWDKLKKNNDKNNDKFKRNLLNKNNNKNDKNGGNKKSGLFRGRASKPADPILAILQETQQKYNENDTKANEEIFLDTIQKFEEKINEDESESESKDNDGDIEIESCNENKSDDQTKDPLYGITQKEYNKNIKNDSKIEFMNNNFYQIQFPPLLPLKVNKYYIKNRTKYSHKMNMGGPFNLTTMGNGKIGKIIKYKNGKIVFKIGDKQNGYITMNMNKCCPISCFQEISSLHQNDANNVSYKTLNKLNNQHIYTCSYDVNDLFTKNVIK